jgi:nucleotide sugar dehydrogenase
MLATSPESVIIIMNNKNRSAEDKKISIVGLGYVGLPTSILLAEAGYEVVGCDKKEKMIEQISKGECPLKDLGLEERLKKVVADKSLTVTVNTIKAISKSDVAIIAVPTPLSQGDGPGLSYVRAAGKDIALGLPDGMLVILESTVYPGATEGVLKPILEADGKKAGVDFGLAYCPERYNPGDSLHTIDKIRRIVGGIDSSSANRAASIYSKISTPEPLVVSDIRTAEATKVMENTQRDLNIALMNEFAMIFEKLGLDVFEVIDAAATKWNFNRYYPGPGVGGHCLPKDPYYLVNPAKKLGYDAKIITAGRKINDAMPHHVFQLLLAALNSVEKPIKSTKVVVLGLSYKENIGDVRNSPSKSLISELIEMKAEITTVDPYVEKSVAKKEFQIKSSKHFSNVYEAVIGAEALVLMVPHDEFRNLDLPKIKSLMKPSPVFVEGNRVYEPSKIKKHGFIFKGIGAGRDN